MISSKLRWFHRIPDLQKARNKTCRHLTVYIEVCIALLCGFADTAFPQRLIEKTQMKVQIVTCLEVLAFEMNSGRILVQISSIQVFKGFLGFVDPREVTESPFLGSFSHCIPASGAHRLERVTAQALCHALPYYFCPAITLYYYIHKVGSQWPQAEGECTVQLQLSLDLSISEREGLKPETQRKGFSWNMAVLITTT